MRVRLGLGVSLLVLSLSASGRAADDAAAKVAAADAAAGAKVFKMYCETCHGPTGAGDGPVGKTLQPPPRNFQTADFKYGGTDQAIFEVITNGAASKGGSPLMAPWGAVIPEADRYALVKFIRTLKKK
jgi:mono/diheme cytochrome c family protein